MDECIRQTELVAGTPAQAPVVLVGILDDPDDGSSLGPQRASAPAAVEMALAAADAAWSAGGWSDVSLADRCAALERFAAALDERAEEIAWVDAIDSGVPIAVTRLMGESLGDTVRGAIATARELGEETDLGVDGRRVELLRLPWGAAAVLTPWNAPAAAAIGKVANALLAGCPTILKPSEQAPSFSTAFAAAALEAELPPGAFQIVHGDREVAATLTGDPRIKAIALIGGQATGRAVAAAAAPRMAALQLELGGSNPALIAADAEIESTAEALVEGMTKLNGQWCEAPRRVIVPVALQTDLVEALEERLAKLKVGPARAESTEFGPLANRGHLARVGAQVEALGGEARPTTELPAGDGLFFSPTIVLGADPARAPEEIFGPVLTVLPYAEEAEGLALANAGDDGLAAYVFGGDRERAFALGTRLHAGEVRIGGTKLIDLVGDSTQSFWGSSGLGSHGSHQLFEAFRGSRIVGEDDPAIPL
jgi:betaine-aldehyde dehydrogenase